MGRRSFKKKRKTARQFGARKSKRPISKKKFAPATSDNDGGMQHDADLQLSTSGSDGTSSARIGETVQEPLEQCVVPAETSVHRTAQVADVADAQPSTSREDVTPTTSTTGSTIQARVEPRYVSREASRKRAATVQESLSAVSATERKMTLMSQGESSTETRAEEEFFLVQRAALNGLLGSALCQQCKQPGLKVNHETKHGLAVKMILTCTACGADADNAWSSPRMENSRAFEVNIRAMQAIKSIGKGATALTDFWSVMNVSHRGLHPKTFQKHLKAEFRPAGAGAAAHVFSEAVAAVREVYSQMEPTPTKNVTVVYDGTWMTRGHASHIGVGTVIEFYTGLVLDCVVLSNYCHGCALGPKEGDDGYNDWKKAHRPEKH
ncbi:hypothetical protein HPB49_007288 [Dermacentor silvarum]|uniref:Uncharacterized protein n=1 Tax=Dermacentor silvarum TaxID=543639 RepID=A0ACB8DX39_DERSI|nr:hypothetical protein HPB49_007288 [Dermacentor silvarum]